MSYQPSTMPTSLLKYSLMSHQPSTMLFTFYNVLHLLQCFHLLQCSSPSTMSFNDLILLLFGAIYNVLLAFYNVLHLLQCFSPSTTSYQPSTMSYKPSIIFFNVPPAFYNVLHLLQCSSPSTMSYNDLILLLFGAVFHPLCNIKLWWHLLCSSVLSQFVYWYVVAFLKQRKVLVLNQIFAESSYSQKEAKIPDLYLSHFRYIKQRRPMNHCISGPYS